MKSLRIVLVIFYMLVVTNVLCETGCDPECDPNADISNIQVEECQHSTCEPSHSNQHNYVKDDHSDSSQKKFLKAIHNKFYLNTYDIVYLDEFHLTESLESELNHQTTHFFPNRKRYSLFQRLKIAAA